jgi:hypothetical protein
MILVMTHHPCLRVGCHRWYQSYYGYNTSCTVLFAKTNGEETLRSHIRTTVVLSGGKANWDLLSAFTFDNFLFYNDAPTTR